MDNNFFAPDLLGDLMASFTPTTVLWTSKAYDLLYTFDWDTLVLDGVTNFFLSLQIQLCLGLYPCFLNIHGKGSTMQRIGLGSISCRASNGCTGILIQSTRLVCANATANLPVFKVYQSALTMKNMTFSDCISSVNGAIIQSYDQASVYIGSSKFENLRTYGTGAAISAVGSRVQITGCFFVNCSADNGGGAVSISTFQSSGSEISVNTDVTINLSVFEDCSSTGAGGAVYASAQVTDLPSKVLVQIISSTFAACTAHVGGAIYSAGSFAFTSLTNCSVEQCRATDVGGALSIINSASLLLNHSRLEENLAGGKGGGAIHLDSAQFYEHASTFVRNSAPLGGGGVLYWQGEVSSGLLSYVNCGVENRALYGSCISSDYRSLKVYSSISSDSYVIPGLSFSLTVVKKDAYGQIIASDDSSLIQIVVAVDSEPVTTKAINTSNQSVLAYASKQPVVDGPIAFPMKGGVASVSIGIKPYFSKASVRERAAVLQSEPIVFFQGFDSETNASMRSSRLIINTSSGPEVCPPGYVLLLDQVSASSGPGSCRFCEPGTYSVYPLSKDPASTTDTPSCINCPAGGNCELGGAAIQFAVGIWALRNGIYFLRSCPAGFQLINSTSGTSSGTFSHDQQRCRACLSGQYIIDPDHDNCQNCPAGCFPCSQN